LKKNQQVIKLFVVLFFSTAFIFGFSHFGAQAYEKLTNTDDIFTDGTSVGFLDVSGTSKSEAVVLLEEKYVEWVQNAKIDIQYSEKTVPFDVNLFQFDATATVRALENGQKNAASMNIDLLQVDELIQVLYPEVDIKKIELTKLTADLIETAARFETGSYNLNISTDYLITDSGDMVINEAIIPLEESTASDLQWFLEDSQEIKINEEGTFSLLEFAKQNNIESSATLSVIATGVYQAIMPTNFTIMERNISNALPTYSALGLEAKVDIAKGTDLIIKNPNKTAYRIQFVQENNNLKVTLHGNQFLYAYEINKKDEKVLKPKTIIQYSPLIRSGKHVVDIKGAEGKIISIFRDVYQGSKLVESQFISEDYYPPVYRVEIHGLTGSQEGTTGGQTTPGAVTDNSTNPTGSQIPSTSDDNQQQDSDSDLWGKPNEQPK
jgi:hypothetical protein